MPIAGAGLGRGMLCVHVATVEAILAVSNPCLFYALAVYALSARSAGSPVSTLIAFSLTMLFLIPIWIQHSWPLVSISLVGLHHGWHLFVPFATVEAILAVSNPCLFYALAVGSPSRIGADRCF